MRINHIISLQSCFSCILSSVVPSVHRSRWRAGRRPALFIGFLASLVCPPTTPLFFPTSAAFAADYYVSPSGSDANPGTIAAPFATIAKARDVVRTENSAMSGDINVYLRGGWHVLTSPLTFDQRDSGTKGHNVIYQGYPGEHVVISGGRRITGWTVHDAGRNVWKANAAGLETRQLYVDCRRAVRAHSGSGLPGPVRNASGYTTTDANMQNWDNKSDIEFVYTGWAGEGKVGDVGCAAPWIEQRIGVASISGTTIVMKKPAWTDADHLNQGRLNPTDIENAYELLDQPGEWYLDRARGVIYYIPRPEDNMKQATIIAPVLETLVSGVGTLDGPIHNIQFKNITFAHATWLKPNTNEGFPETQANYAWGIATWQRSGFPGGNVVFRTAHNIVFERCIFTHLGGEGIELSGGCKKCGVNGCVFTDISANPVRIGTVNDHVRTDIRARDEGNQVTNCYIHHTPSEYHGGCCIFAGFVSDLLISHNEIGHFPYTGISVGWGWTWAPDNYMKNNQLSYNYIHHAMQLLRDGGAIYTLGPQRNSTINNNWLDGMPGDNNEAGSIYPDQGSAYFEISSNVCSNSGGDQLAHITYDALANAGSKWNTITDCHDINAHDNWICSVPYEVKKQPANIVVAGNHQISGAISSWPQAARDIANNAGIQKSYSDVKTLRDACSFAFGPGAADATPPSAPPVIRDGASREVGINFSYYTTQLSANWDASIDAESGIYRYWYAIGTRAGDTDVVSWTDNGNNVSVTRTGLTLKRGATYYFSVKAENRVGLLSPPMKSRGQCVFESSLSTGKTGVASSVYGGGVPANYAFDQRYDTWWATPYHAPEPQWIYVDLGKIYNIDTVILTWNWNAKAYKIQVSSDAAITDATPWNTVYAIDSAAGAGRNGRVDEIHFSPVNARYVRMLGTKTGMSFGGYAICEFEVYGGDRSRPGAE